MYLRKNIVLITPLVFLLCFLFTKVNSQTSQPDNFRAFIIETENKVALPNSDIYVIPNENDFAEWRKVLYLFRAQSFDSCKYILSKYNYELIHLKDAVTGNLYDIVREKYPIRYGWGTYIYNRNSKKRLYIHINHPIDDPHVLQMGAHLFRDLRGQWLLIAGTSKWTVPRKSLADVGKVKRSIFHQWHESLSSLTYVSLSLHSFDGDKYPFPINSTDIIISNGRTSDEQWGISQLSLAFRDTLRAAGYSCGLAMYDSGYARLAGGWNVQGIFSNDSAGFGHWLYIEFSKNIRERKLEHSKLVSAFDRGLELTGKKISQQVNRSFGLVSPRVVRIDSGRRLYFPPQNADTYQVVSYNPISKKNDTIDVRTGNWLDLSSKNKSITAIKVLDSTNKDLFQQIRRNGGSTVVSKILESPKRVTSVVKFKDQKAQDSVSTEDEEERRQEPLQVHRIPLQPVLQQIFETEITSDISSYRWDGIVPAWFTPNLPAFDLPENQFDSDEIKNLPRFLIPIINNSYLAGRQRFLGIQMTNILVKEITRLVSDYQMYDQDFGLMAEQAETGDFYLRIFPTLRDSSLLVTALK
ncbi:MAG: hypothetical protein QME52_08310 [Bacteroidota bacterium]|nr:hypothetical protein [Bacteroidota bacterium]